MKFDNLNSAYLLSTDEMYLADKLTMEAGISGAVLMENAGQAVFDVVVENYAPQRTIVLCGPGNNGGDGFVVARLLRDAGWDVSLCLFGDLEGLKGDAAHMASLWSGDIEKLSSSVVEGASLAIDALFGAGLDRDIEGVVLDVINTLGKTPVVAIDVPSGINGNTGEIMGQALKATHTVTFFKSKAAHYLQPARHYCGRVIVADIGIEGHVLDTIKPNVLANSPELWRDLIPTPKYDDHKFSRGYALVTGGKDMIGAATLAARAAQRIGAGIVTIASPEKVAPLYRLALQSAVVKSYRDTAYYKNILNDERIDACLIGPGLGRDFTSQEKVLTTLRSSHKCVLDADALSMFEGHADLLLDSVKVDCVLTPHEGEFSKIFPDLMSEGKISRVRKAAVRCGAVVLLKGSDTVIAAPDGQVIINSNAPPWLATAGAGDVLAGLITGLMGQGCDSFVACAIACWVHGEAANYVGIGLIAEDIIEKIPAVLSNLVALELA